MWLWNPLTQIQGNQMTSFHFILFIDFSRVDFKKKEESLTKRGHFFHFLYCIIYISHYPKEVQVIMTRIYFNLLVSGSSSSLAQTEEDYLLLNLFLVNSYYFLYEAK